MEELTEKKIRDFREAFDLFDKDKDGAITRDELALVMKSLNFHPTDEELKTIMDDIDVNSNGKVEFEEFVTLLHKRGKEEDVEEEVIKAFKVFDKEESGTVSRKELKNIMLTLGELLSEDEIEEMLQEADIYGDGKIRYEKFVKAMLS